MALIVELRRFTAVTFDSGERITHQSITNIINSMPRSLDIDDDLYGMPGTDAKYDYGSKPDDTTPAVPDPTPDADIDIDHGA